MIADISITEKSFGSKNLMTNVSFTINDGQKVGLIGRNGVGKSTLFAILSGSDQDFSGQVTYKRGTTIVATAQEYHDLGEQTVLQYILSGLPEYSQLSHIIETYPLSMGDNLKKIEVYSSALQRFNDKGFYQIEQQIERELDNFQLYGLIKRPFKTLSGGQKRLVEIVKIMYSKADLALIDEPTNHMDSMAKKQFINWLTQAREAVLVITHDRDVLAKVDRIVEFKDGASVSYDGNYDAYLKQNTTSVSTQMNQFELVKKRISNLKQKVIDYQRLKEKSRNPSTIQKFKRLELNARQELSELQAKDKPTFWIDKNSAEQLNYKTAAKYDQFKSQNIKINLQNEKSRSRHLLLSARDLALGYKDKLLFEGLDADLYEGEALQLDGRNGAGKTTFIKYLLASREPNLAPDVICYGGSLKLDRQIRIGVYEQEITPVYFEMALETAIERLYLDKNLSISQTKIHQLLSDYLFSQSDHQTLIKNLSGGQKARFQLISLLANKPELLILDEPTNHLDLPSIEELEQALQNYRGAILYVSHDGYFCQAVGGQVLTIGAN